MFGLISTKDLYICELKYIRRYSKNGKRYILLAEPSDFIIGRKYYDDYIDVFTNSKYESLHNSFDDGVIVVNKVVPLNVSKKYISSKDAKRILANLKENNESQKKLTLSKS